MEIRLMRMEKKELFLWMLRSTVILKIYEDHKISYIDDGYSMEETLIPEYHMFDFETLVGKEPSGDESRQNAFGWNKSQESCCKCYPLKEVQP